MVVITEMRLAHWIRYLRFYLRWRWFIIILGANSVINTVMIWYMILR